MRKNSVLQLLLIIFICILVTIIACTNTEDDKIPITTTSEKAREYYLQARDLNEKLRAQESIKFFELSVKEDTNFALGYLNLSFVYPTAKGRFENFNKALSLINKVSEGEKLIILGVEAAINGYQLRQRKLFKQLVELYPDDERAYNLLGMHYYGQQEYKEAIKFFEKSIEIDPDFSAPYNLLGYAHRFLENYEEAEKTLKKYIELIPSDPNPYDSYAELLCKIGKFDESIDYYKKALNLDPNFVPSHIGIASNLNFLGKHLEAREQLNQLLSIARDDGERRAAHFAIMISFIDECKLDKALAEAKKPYAVSEKINDEAVMYGDLGLMGAILLESGKYEEARQKFEKALKVLKKSNLSDEVKNNGRRAYLYNTARIALKEKDFILAKKNAEAYRKQVISIENPFQYRLSHGLDGMIALEEKDYDRAINEFQQANQQNPYNFYRMALAYQGKGDLKRAKKLCYKAANYNVVNDFNYALIRIKARQLCDSLK